MQNMLKSGAHLLKGSFYATAALEAGKKVWRAQLKAW